jgi:TPR repeat protein
MKYGNQGATQSRLDQLLDCATAYRQEASGCKNLPISIQLLQLGADSGHPESNFALTEIYRDGEVEIERNQDRAVLYARRNYEQVRAKDEAPNQMGEFLGMIQFNEFLRSGYSTIPKDERQAERLLRIAHGKRFAFQQYRYAERLWSGRGIKKDQEKAKEYRRIALSHGFPVQMRFPF